MTRGQEIAGEILRQLGGQGRLSAMVGAKHFYATDRGVVFQISGRAKFNAIKIELNSMDTYDVTLTKFRGVEVKDTKEHNGIYADMLMNLLEKETGFAFSL